MIQDKTKTRFGRWIHDVLARYIYLYIKKKMLQSASKNV